MLHEMWGLPLSEKYWRGLPNWPVAGVTSNLCAAAPSGTALWSYCSADPAALPHQLKQVSFAKCFLLWPLLSGMCAVSRCITHTVQQSMHRSICLVLSGVMLAYRYFSCVWRETEMRKSKRAVCCHTIAECKAIPCLLASAPTSARRVYMTDYETENRLWKYFFFNWNLIIWTPAWWQDCFALHSSGNLLENKRQQVMLQNQLLKS